MRAPAAAAVAATPTASLAGAGNSDAARSCKAGKWKDVVASSDRTPFKNQGDCVSFVARGGELAPLHTLTVTFPKVSSAQACQVSFLYTGAPGEEVRLSWREEATPGAGGLESGPFPMPWLEYRPGYAFWLSSALAGVWITVHANDVTVGPLQVAR